MSASQMFFLRVSQEFGAGEANRHLPQFPYGKNPCRLHFGAVYNDNISRIYIRQFLQNGVFNFLFLMKNNHERMRLALGGNLSY
jgi:hypothetical protein